jgi:hypothetical protein
MTTSGQRREGAVRIKQHRAERKESSTSPWQATRAWAPVRHRPPSDRCSLQRAGYCGPKPGIARSILARKAPVRRCRRAPRARAISGNSWRSYLCSSTTRRLNPPQMQGMESAGRTEILPARTQTSGPFARALRLVYARTRRKLPFECFAITHNAAPPRDQP